ncbi:MAG: antitoxin [Gammaproteobacteria bacterium]|nr:antitoxin [Gammaproteobacteria bacterium]
MDEMRTTLDIDGPILRELKKRQTKEGKSLGRLVSDLLARALQEEAAPADGPQPAWIAKPMGARVNLSDKEAVYRLLDR